MKLRLRSLQKANLGLIRVDEPEKRLFFIYRWAQGTGDVHIFRWGNYARDDRYVNFYRASDGELKGVICPVNEFPELDQGAERIDLGESKRNSPSLQITRHAVWPDPTSRL